MSAVTPKVTPWGGGALEVAGMGQGRGMVAKASCEAVGGITATSLRVVTTGRVGPDLQGDGNGGRASLWQWRRPQGGDNGRLQSDGDTEGQLEMVGTMGTWKGHLGGTPTQRRQPENGAKLPQKMTRTPLKNNRGTTEKSKDPPEK